MKQKYHVNRQSPPPKDDSFKLCVCSMLLFLCLCGIISIPLLFLNNPGKNPLEESRAGVSDQLSKDRNIDDTRKSGSESTLPNNFGPEFSTSTSTLAIIKHNPTTGYTRNAVSETTQSSETNKSAKGRTEFTTSSTIATKSRGHVTEENYENATTVTIRSEHSTSSTSESKTTEGITKPISVTGESVPTTEGTTENSTASTTEGITKPISVTGESVIRAEETTENSTAITAEGITKPISVTGESVTTTEETTENSTASTAEGITVPISVTGESVITTVTVKSEHSTTSITEGITLSIAVTGESVTTAEGRTDNLTENTAEGVTIPISVTESVTTAVGSTEYSTSSPTEGITIPISLTGESVKRAVETTENSTAITAEGITKPISVTGESVTTAEGTTDNSSASTAEGITIPISVTTAVGSTEYSTTSPTEGITIPISVTGELVTTAERTTENSTASTAEGITTRISETRDLLTTAERTRDNSVTTKQFPSVTTPKPGANECRTKQCYTMASRMLSLIDATAFPCENFYLYACGGLLNNPTLLEEDVSVDVFSRIQEVLDSISSSSPHTYRKFKNFYNGCIMYHTMVNVEEQKNQGLKVLNSVGPFWTHSSDRKEEINDLTKLLIRLFRHGSAPLFEMQIDINLANSSHFQLVLKPPSYLKFTFSPYFVFLEDQKHRCQKKITDFVNLNNAYETYKNCMLNDFVEKSVEAMEFFRVFDNVTAEEKYTLLIETKVIVKAILGIIKDFTSPETTQEAIQQRSVEPRPLTELHNMIDWNSLVGDFVTGGSDLETVEVPTYTGTSEYISNMLDNINTLNERSVYNALLAIFAHDLYTDIVMAQPSSKREHYCIQSATNLMPVVASNIYLSTITPETQVEVYNQTNKLFEQLKSTMQIKLNSAKWIDVITLNTLLKKLQLMNLELPTTFTDDYLNSSVIECNLDGKQHIEDSICLIKQLQNQLYQRLNMNPHSREVRWSHFLTSFASKTAFIYNLNIFMVPLALVLPLYNEQNPKHIVMARLGNLLARGIAHNFDQAGVKFSDRNTFGDIISEKANPTYQEEIKKLNDVYQFTKYYVVESPKNMSQFELLDLAQLTRNERFSDLCAANLTLSTIPHQDFILPWLPFSPHQAYFLAWAQTFCTKKSFYETFTDLFEATSLPPFERVNALVSNLEAFSEAFNCKVGSTMSNTVKADQFPTYEMYTVTDTSPDAT